MSISIDQNAQLAQFVRFADAAAGNMPIAEFAGANFEGAHAYTEIAAEVGRVVRDHNRK